jgi:hypothetical protein
MVCQKRFAIEPRQSLRFATQSSKRYDTFRARCDIHQDHLLLCRPFRAGNGTIQRNGAAIWGPCRPDTWITSTIPVVEERRAPTGCQHALASAILARHDERVDPISRVHPYERELLTIRRPVRRTRNALDQASWRAAKKWHAPQRTQLSHLNSTEIDEAAIGRDRRAEQVDSWLWRNDLNVACRRRLPDPQAGGIRFALDVCDVPPIRRYRRSFSVPARRQLHDLDIVEQCGERPGPLLSVGGIVV